MLALLCTNSILHAHNPLSARYYLEVNDDINILNIYLSQYGLHEAIKKQFSDVNFETIDEIEYKTLVVNYIKGNFNLQINGEVVQLLDGGLKLGTHQTNLKFVTSKLPRILNTLDVSIKAFSENKEHQTIFSTSINGKTSKVILKESNDYRASMIIENDTMIENRTVAFNLNYLWCLLIVPVFLIGRQVIGKPNL